MAVPVRILITGSRSWEIPQLAARVVAGLIEKHGPSLLICHGHCPSGVDRSFDNAAHAAGVQVERHPADWNRHGKGAGPKRNQAMVDLGATACLAFSPDLSRSAGTSDAIRRALKAGIPTWWISSEDAPPVRQKLPG